MMLHKLVRTPLYAVIQHPYLIILSILVFVIAVTPHIRNLYIDASADSLMLENDPDLEYYREVHRHFGLDDFIVVGFKPHTGILDESTISLVDSLSRQFEQIEGIADVISIVSVPLLTQPQEDEDTGEITYPTLLSPQVDVNKAFQEFTTSPLYVENLVSKDLSLTALQVAVEKNEKLASLLERKFTLIEKSNSGFLNEEEQSELESIRQEVSTQKKLNSERFEQILTSVRTVLSGIEKEGKYFLAGTPLIINDVKVFAMNDLETFGIAIAAIMVIVLFVFFRNPAWIFLALTCAVLNVLIVSGIVGLLGYQLTVISSNFIALLIIFSIALSIHVIIRYQEVQSLNPDESVEENTKSAVLQIVTPCFYMVLTSAVAFFSLTLSDIRPVITFGYMMVFGLVSAFVLTFTVLPALIRMISPKPRKLRKDTSSAFLDSVLHLVMGHKKSAVAVLIVMFLVSMAGISQLTVENRFIDYFKKSTDIYQGLEIIDLELGGTVPLEVMLEFIPDSEEKLTEDDEVDEFDDYLAELEDTQDDFTAKSYWYNRSGIKQIDKVHDYLESLPQVGKVLSLSSIEEVFRTVNDGESLEDFHLSLIFSKIPEDMKQSIIFPYVSVEGNQARILARIKDSDPSLVRNDLLNKIRADIQGSFIRDNEEVRLTGVSVLYNNLLQSLFRSQILTLGTVFACIFIVLAVLFRSLKLALVGALPNAFTVLFILGLIGLVGIPLDIMTITTAAITVGVGVDYAIHYIHRYKREYAQVGDHYKALRTAQTTVGKALYFTSITIALGFLILVLSNFIPSIYFGLLTSLAMLIALFATFSVIPLLLAATPTQPFKNFLKPDFAQQG